MKMWLKDIAPPSLELNPLPAPAVNDDSKAAMEMLRDQLSARAAAVLAAAGPDPATGGKGSNAGIEKNRLPKASEKLGRWLRDKMEKKDRFPKRLWAGLRKPVDLYDRLRRFAEEIGKAGEQINAVASGAGCSEKSPVSAPRRIGGIPRSARGPLRNGLPVPHRGTEQANRRAPTSGRRAPETKSELRAAGRLDPRSRHHPHHDGKAPLRVC